MTLIGSPIFLSYSTHDGKELALELQRELEKKIGPNSVWRDRKNLRAGSSLDEQIQQAIENCEIFLFLMTEDSVTKESFCTFEWRWALEKSKTVLPIRMVAGVKAPFRFGDATIIDCSNDFCAGLAEVKDQLNRWMSWEGKLSLIEERINRLNREIKFNVQKESTSIEEQFTHLKVEVQALKKILKELHGVSKEKKTKTPCKIIGSPDFPTPSFLHGRDECLKLGSSFISDEAKRVLVVLGRPGVGKTTLVYRLLQDLDRGELFHGSESCSVDGIVYLNFSGSREMAWPKFFLEVCKLLDAREKGELETLHKDPSVRASEKMSRLLEAFSMRKVIVLFDGIDELLQSDSHNFRDPRIENAFQTLLKWPTAAIKVILTTQVYPQKLSSAHAESQQEIDLAEGLMEPFAEDMLREMDPDGSLGLKEAPNEKLARVCELTHGNPGVMWQLIGILRGKPRDYLDQLLKEEGKPYIEELLGREFEHLESTDKFVFQSLAVFGQPIMPIGINYMLEPYWPKCNSEPVLGRLLNMKLVQKKGEAYFLRKSDRLYALSQISDSQPSYKEKTDSPVFALDDLRHRGAEFYKSMRKPIEELRTKDDVVPHLAEFDLRVECGEYVVAAGILKDIRKAMLTSGYYGEMAERHERLRNELVDLKIKDSSMRALGWIYQKLGELEKNAIPCYQDGLQIANELKDRKLEALYMSNLGICYEELNNIPVAALHCEQALRLSRDVGDAVREAHSLNILGDCYLKVGMMEESLDSYEKSLNLARKNRTRQRKQEVLVLVNMARLYGELGKKMQAQRLLGEASSIADNIGYQLGKASALMLRAEFHTEDSEFHQGLSLYDETIAIADKIQFVHLQMAARIGQALGLLFLGDLGMALECSRTACRYDHLHNNFEAHEILGLTALRHGKIDEAIKAFDKSIEWGDKLLGQTYQNYRVLNAKGLALCGLVVCRETNEYISRALEAFRAAYTVNKSVGTVQRVIRTLDELAKSDQKKRLTQMRSEITVNG